jgi:hypothetical protein
MTQLPPSCYHRISAHGTSHCIDAISYGSLGDPGQTAYGIFSQIYPENKKEEA